MIFTEIHPNRLCLTPRPGPPHKTPAIVRDRTMDQRVAGEAGVKPREPGRAEPAPRADAVGAPHASNVLAHYKSVVDLIERVKPAMPYFALHPKKFEKCVRLFLDGFPGTPMFAVKSNPNPHVLDQIYQAGMRHFDTASLNEIKLVRERYPDAHCHFMAPVRISGAAATAFHDYGVGDFVVDHGDELEKLLRETGGKGIRVFVRIATPLGGAMLELSSKFGTTPEEGAKLLTRTVEAGALPAITFHVGSQCLSPFNYAQAMDMAKRTAALAGVELTALDIGGGFPAAYPSDDVPPHHWYFDTIREALASFPMKKGGDVFCEPGRALSAEGMSLIDKVSLRKGDALYLNDGVYGNMDELTLGWAMEYPRKVYYLDANGKARPRIGEAKPFKIFGPTCDTIDVLPRPMMLPANVAMDDYIVFETCGAYSTAVRTAFNGFWSDDWAIVDD